MTQLCVRLALVAALLGASPAVADEITGDPGRGAKFYSDNCTRCHNARPAFEHRDREWSIVLVHMRIIGRMPGAQARDVEAFLSASNRPPREAGPSAAAAKPLSGAALVDQYGCKGCHVIGGSGGLVGPNLDTVFERRDETWVRGQIANPRANKPDSVMPPLGLSEQQISAIVEFLRRPR